MTSRSAMWSKLKEQFGMAAAATAGATAPFVFGFQEGGLTVGEILTSVGMGVATVSGGVFASRLANYIDEQAKERLSDPKALLRNRDLHRLTGRAVATLLRVAADDDQFQHDDQVRLAKLAEAAEAEWDELADTPGFGEQIDSLSRDQWKTRFNAAASTDPADRRALDVAIWATILEATGKKHSCHFSHTSISVNPLRDWPAWVKTTRSLRDMTGSKVTVFMVPP